MNVKRTYPQPDSPEMNIGPRERALAVFKYLLDLEPEDAGKHLQYPLLVAAFEQEGRRAIRVWEIANPVSQPEARNRRDAPQMVPSLVTMLTGEKSAEVRVQRFQKDGL